MISLRTRVPIKSSPGSFNPFLMRFPWIKKVSQQDGKLRQVRAQAREFLESYIGDVRRFRHHFKNSATHWLGNPARSALAFKSYIVHRT